MLAEKRMALALTDPVPGCRRGPGWTAPGTIIRPEYRVGIPWNLFRRIRTERS